MRRRKFILLASAALLPGCLGDGGGRSTDEPTPSTAPQTETPTATPTWTPGGTGDAGPSSPMVELTVAHGFAGNVTLGGGCAPDSRAVDSGETVTVERERAGEGCGYAVEVNGSEQAQGGVDGYETVMIDVTADGSVEVATLAR